MTPTDFQDVDGYGYLYETASGRLLSQGTRFSDPTPSNWTLLIRPAEHNAENERWNESTKNIVPFLDDERADQLDREATELSARAASLRGE
jgi:hypothetical protein